MGRNILIVILLQDGKIVSDRNLAVLETDHQNLRLG